VSLSYQKINFKHFLKEKLVLLREEELKWYKRAKVKTLLALWKQRVCRAFHAHTAKVSKRTATSVLPAKLKGLCRAPFVETHAKYFRNALKIQEQLVTVSQLRQLVRFRPTCPFHYQKSQSCREPTILP
jgi:hypothetical protein